MKLSAKISSFFPYSVSILNFLAKKPSRRSVIRAKTKKKQKKQRRII
jgi:hypothetical protein